MPRYPTAQAEKRSETSEQEGELVKSDSEIRDDVIKELRWDPQITDPDAIGVHSGVTTVLDAYGVKNGPAGSFARQCLMARLAQLDDDGKLRDEHASLAKVFCTSGCREVVSHARELHGGNGILLSYDVARFVADAEALYSYEGTKQVNSLIVGRAVTA